MAEKQDHILVSSNDIAWIKTKLMDMDVTLTKLQQTVIGDKEYGQKGLVEQVNEHRKYIESANAQKAKIIGGGAVIGVLYTFLLKFWDKIFG